MLSMKIENDALFNDEQTAQSENAVARPAIKLTPVAFVQEDGEGIYSRCCAEMYFAPDEQTIIRLPCNYSGDLSYDYDKATQVPETHPVWAALKDPKRVPDKEIKIFQSAEGPIGSPANQMDAFWLKGILEPQIRQQIEELKASGLKL
jgi:hypothetical protein